ncbi:MAG: MFS transporter [Nitriliruptorales bacterium]|nr:MFS transporter [Nitriliruptorales bacterium]
MSTQQPSVGYRAALREPVVGRLYAAFAMSVVGDYVAQGALLFLAFERTDLILGPAAVLAVAGLPAVLTGGIGGAWLDRLPRREALIGLQLLGAVSVLLPVLFDATPWVFVAAGLLGAVRAANVAVRSGAIADGVREEHRGPLLGLTGTTEQVGQVLGYLTGATLFHLIGSDAALLTDAATFVLAGIILTRLRINEQHRRAVGRDVRAGVREIFGHPILRILAPVVWMSALAGAVPETMASAITDDGDAWRTIVLISAPAAQAVTSFVIGRTEVLKRLSFQMTHLVWLALAYGLAMRFADRAPLLAAANALVGVGLAWTLGPQLAFLRHARPERMAQVTGTMIAGLIVSEAAGSLALGWLADATSVQAAYRTAGFLVLATAVVGWIAMQRTPDARALDRAFTERLFR